MNYYKNPFKIIGAIGNNEFSFDQRKVKEITIARLNNSNESFVLEEGETAFVEIEDEEQVCKGLKELYKFDFEGKTVYLFDNHNHCFFFTAYEIISKGYKNINMIHIDQHKDMRVPYIDFEEYKLLDEDYRNSLIKENTIDFNNSYINNNDILSLAYEYTNLCLNVGNYIVPLINSNFINKVEIVDSKLSLENIRSYKNSYMLNIDLDFFSKDMDYIEERVKLEVIKPLIKNAEFITISTSPFFIEVERCKMVLGKLFSIS